MYKLEIVPKITKELILKKVAAERIFEHYLGIPVKKGLFRSPTILRADRNPTCSFYKNKEGTLIYKDFAGPSFDFVGCVMHLFQCNYYIALKIIAHDFDIIPLKNVPKNAKKIEYTNVILEETTKSNIQVEIKPFSEKELEWWNKFNISLITLNKFKVFSIKSIFLNGNYFTTSTENNPIFGYYGGCTDEVEDWRLYMPFKTSYRFLTNWSKSMIQGSKQLPMYGDFIVITKSMKDVMSLYEFGITAIAPNSENLFLSEEQYNLLKFRFNDIYLLYDRDLPGIKAAKNIRKKFPNIKILLMPDTKDFSDYVEKHGVEKTKKLVNKWKQKRKEK